MLRNNYQLRHVVEQDAKPCFICYKPTTSLLLNEVHNADFFYTCDVHLRDKHFATERAATLSARNENAEALEREIVALKKQWDDVKAAKGEGDQEAEEKPQEKGRACAGEPKAESNAKPMVLPKHYTLNKDIFAMRQRAAKLRSAARAQKVNVQDIEFPEVPNSKLV